MRTHTHTWHSPVQVGEDRPGLDPKVPAGQLVHDDAPAREYVPDGQMDAVGDVEKAGQAYPAVHGPVQLEFNSPVALP
jgi:hypothetical protein